MRSAVCLEVKGYGDIWLVPPSQGRLKSSPTPTKMGRGEFIRPFQRRLLMVQPPEKAEEYPYSSEGIYQDKYGEVFY